MIIRTLAHYENMQKMAESESAGNRLDDLIRLSMEINKIALQIYREVMEVIADTSDTDETGLKKWFMLCVRI